MGGPHTPLGSPGTNGDERLSEGGVRLVFTLPSWTPVLASQLSPLMG